MDNLSINLLILLMTSKTSMLQYAYCDDGKGNNHVTLLVYIIMISAYRLCNFETHSIEHCYDSLGTVLWAVAIHQHSKVISYVSCQQLLVWWSIDHCLLCTVVKTTCMLMVSDHQRDSQLQYQAVWYTLPHFWLLTTLNTVHLSVTTVVYRTRFKITQSIDHSYDYLY